MVLELSRLSTVSKKLEHSFAEKINAQEDKRKWRINKDTMLHGQEKKNQDKMRLYWLECKRFV